MSEIETPECAKLAQVHHERDTIVEFIEWLRGQGIHLAHYSDLGYREEMLMPEVATDQSFAHRFLGIDEEKLEAERRVLLDALREETR